MEYYPDVSEGNILGLNDDEPLLPRIDPTYNCPESTKDVSYLSSRKRAPLLPDDGPNTLLRGNEAGTPGADPLFLLFTILRTPMSTGSRLQNEEFRFL